MKDADRRLTFVHAWLLLGSVVLVGRAAQVQLLDRDEWAARAQRQHFSALALPAARGPIFDATGSVLVESRERTSLSVAPSEVNDLGAVTRSLGHVGVPPAVLARLREPGRKWLDIPGSFPPADVAPLAAMRGVYSKPLVDRVYAPAGGIRPIVGKLDDAGRPLDGIELALDSLLRGDSARLRVPRDREGRPLPGPAAWSVLPHSGAGITLTINRALQDICERALALAVDTLDASGGDIVVLNPHSGEILALASRRSEPAPAVNTAITEPFEPGSTLKPFLAAALLQRGRARADEVIPTFDGELELEGRTIHDIHKASALTLADVIRYSSNIGIVGFSGRLSAREKYELLRDLGFGTPTGVPLPAEAAGTLREPRVWSRQTPASLAMGYELSVTSLQLAVAYAALANGGVLLEPQLIKEIRGADGRVLHRARPRVIRRVFSPAAASAVREMLLAVVDSGTAIKADLANYQFGGKSGTARRVVGGRYAPGRYTASFVGLFPGNDPQYVVLVKLDDPQRAIYGGETAAPLTRVVLEAALAARDAALDRTALLAAGRPSLDSFVRARRVTDAGIGAEPTRPDSVRSTPPSADTQIAVALPPPPPPRVPPSAPPPLPPRRSRARLYELPASLPVASALRGPPRAVPDVSGLRTRAAARALHAAGFRVVVDRAASSQSPAPGTVLQPGAAVRIVARP